MVIDATVRRQIIIIFERFINLLKEISRLLDNLERNWLAWNQP